MENKRNKKLEDLTDKVMKDVSIETPSFGFTQHLMRKIEEKEEKSLHTKSLLPLKYWLIATVVCLSCFAVLLWGDLTYPEKWFSGLGAHLNQEGAISPSFQPLSISNIIVYAVGFFVLMIIFQTIILKRLIDARR